MATLPQPVRLSSDVVTVTQTERLSLGEAKRVRDSMVIGGPDEHIVVARRNVNVAGVLS